MKRLILAIALIMALGFGAKVQYNSDSFFMQWEDVSNGVEYTRDGGGPGFPGNHNGNDTPATPLGSGLVILGALGAGYAVAKRNKR